MAEGFVVFVIELSVNFSENWFLFLDKSECKLFAQNLQIFCS